MNTLIDFSSNRLPGSQEQLKLNTNYICMKEKPINLNEKGTGIAKEFTPGSNGFLFETGFYWPNITTICYLADTRVIFRTIPAHAHGYYVYKL